VWVDADSLEVSVEDHVVTLYGVVPSLVERRNAIDLAAQSGARHIDATHLLVADESNAVLANRQVPILDDASVEASIRDALSLDPRVIGSSVSVTVRGGTARLEGRVLTPEASRSAEATAANTRGVFHVENKTSIKPSQETPDPEIEARAHRRLISWDLQQAERVLVSANMGDVVVNGFVRTYSDRELVEEMLTQIEGVLSISNRLNVETADIDGSRERRIERVEERLFWNAALREAEISVSVEGSTIVLEGRVPSLAAKREALRATRMTGEDSIIDRLVIHGDSSVKGSSR